MPDIDLNIIPRPGAAGARIVFRSASTTPDPLSTTDEFLLANDGRVKLLVRNGAGACNITVHTHKVVDGLTLPDRTVTVPANQDWTIGPFDPDTYNDPDGKVRLEFDDIANVQVAVLRD